MSKLNKIITNRPVVLTNEEVNNLSETLSAVRTAGGGEGGHLYTGDNKYIGVDNGNYKIKFLDNAAEKLESISSKLDKTEAANTYLTSANAKTLYQTKEAMSAYAKKTEIPDSITAFDDTDTVIYSYLNPLTGDIQQQINGKQNKLQFDLNAKGEISAIGTLNGTTTALAGANGITGDYYSASNPSGFINSTQAETQILEKHYLTEASGDLLYVPIPKGLSEGQYYAMTTSSWKVIQGAGDVSGISTVAHDDTLTGNGNNENLGVDITKIQTKLTDAQIQNITDVTTLKTASSTWDNVSAKLNTTDFNTYTGTTAPSTYQPIGNYLSSNALEGYATQDWVNQQGYITQETDWTNTIQEASAKAYNDATANANSLYQTKSDMANYLTTSDAADTYQPKGNYAPEAVTATVNTLTAASAGWNEVTAKLDKSIYSNASGNWENTYNVVNQYSAAGKWLTEHQSLTNYYTKSETSGASELSTEFAKYVTSSNVTTQGTDYVMTTTGWKVLSLPGGGMTQVIHDDTLTGQGNADNSKLGVVWSALSGNTINSAFSAGSATSAYKAASASAAKRLQDSTAGPSIQVGDVTALQNWASSNSSTWDGVSAKLGTSQYANDSATFVTKPDTTQTELNNNYLIYSTLTDPSSTTGWMPLSANYYSKTEADGRYQKKEDMSNYLTTAKYETDSATFVTSSSNTITGTKQYALTTTGWSDIGLNNYLPTSGGTVSGDVIVSSSGTCLLTVGTEATLMGQSRVVNLGDTTARGTNWLGVTQSNQGFLKYVNGGNVGALNGTSIQINFAPDGANSYGNITVNSQDNMSKVINVPTASYDSMSSFDNTNGPNYMLRKTASGFDIGACVINVTELPAQTEANTYYFIYDT